MSYDVRRWISLVEAASPNIVTTVTKTEHGYVVLAYRAGAAGWLDDGSEFWGTDHPAGMTAKNIIGRANFATEGKPIMTSHGVVKGPPYALKVDVHEDWRRRGVATAMYDAFTAATGLVPAPAGEQTDDARAFWANRRQG